MKSVREYKVVLSSEEVLTFGGFKSIDDLIIYKLHKQFVGICYKNSIVTKILNIERRSAVLQEKLSFAADMYVNVIFNVECATFAKNDVISCCRVSKIQPDGRIDTIPELSEEFDNLNNNLSVKLKDDMILEPKKVLIYLAIRYNEKLRHVKVGDKIPAIVSEVNYRTMTPYVVIRALPFTNQPKKKIYKILPSTNKNKNLPVSIALDNSIVDDLDELDDDDSKSNASFRRKRMWYERSVYSNILESINNIYNECMDSKYEKHEEFKHFLKELYPYPNSKDEGKKIKWYEANIDDLVEIKPEDLERNAKIITDTNEIKMDEVIPIRQKEFLIKILNQQLSFIKMVKEFSLHYSTSTNLS